MDKYDIPAKVQPGSTIHRRDQLHLVLTVPVLISTAPGEERAHTLLLQIDLHQAHELGLSLVQSQQRLHAAEEIRKSEDEGCT